MIKYENDCVDCGLPCLMNGCKYYHVPHLYCDVCGNEEEILYTDGNSQLCRECYLDAAEKITCKDTYYNETY